MTLDKEEKELLEAYDGGKIKTRKPTLKERQDSIQIAKKTLKKDKRITIRLYEHDFLGIQKKAFESGLPYQSLISSLIHRFVEGEIKVA